MVLRTLDWYTFILCISTISPHRAAYKTNGCRICLNSMREPLQLSDVCRLINEYSTFIRMYIYISKINLTRLKRKAQYVGVNLVQMLAGAGSGAHAKTLRIAALVLVYSTAEYGSQVRGNRTHVRKIDTQLNSVMRVISWTIKSTPLQWLLALANI